MITPEEREFLVESNAIEGVFEKDALEASIKAWEYLMGQEELTEAVILETHRILMQPRSAWEESTATMVGQEYAGKFRTGDVYVGMYKCLPPHLFPIFLGNWITDTMRLDPKPDAKHLHVRYEKIHPFFDGNGRTGRMFYNWTLIKRLKKGLAIFGSAPHEKKEYYLWFK